MASNNASYGSGYSDGSGYSNSNSGPVQTPQSQWGTQLSQLLSALGQNQYNWAMNQFNRGSGITDQNISQYMDLAGKGAGLAQDLLGRYKDVFTPLMDNYIRQAGTYNSENRQRFMAGQAESTVGQADQQARDEAERKLQGFGINPNSGRYMDQILSSRVQDAAARAGAGTQASLNVADRGRAMTEKAAQMGQNVPGMAVNALQSAYTGVTGAENAILGMLNTGANLTQSAAPFFNASGNANKPPSQGSTGQAKNQNQSRNMQRSQGMSSDPQGGGGSKGGNQQPGGDKGGGGGGGKKGGGQQPSGGGKPGPLAKNTKVNTDPRILDNPDPGGYHSDQANVNDMLDNAGNNPDWQPGPGLVNRYENSGTGDDNGGGYGSDPWDPATYAGSQGSPWWMNNGSSGSQGQVDTSDPNIWNGGKTFTGQTDNNMPAAPQDWGANGGNSFGGDNPDPWSGVDTSGTFGNIGGQNFEQNSMPNDAQQASGGFGGNYFGQNGNYQQQGGGYDQPQGQQGNYFGQQGNYQQQGGGYGNYGQQGNYFGQQGNYQQQGGGYSGGGYQGGGYQQPQGSSNYDSGGYYASGGKVRGGQGGGVIPPGMSPSQGRNTDDVKAFIPQTQKGARLNVGEFVIPKDVREHKGTEFFTNLIKKSRQARLGMSGPPARAKMKPALRMRPTFNTQG